MIIVLNFSFFFVMSYTVSGDNTDNSHAYLQFMILIAIPDIQWLGYIPNVHYLQIILRDFLICKYESPCTHDVIPVYVENNFDCNVHVWSPESYSFTHSSHLSIPWNRFNKYKTLLRNPSFAASYIHIKIIVTNKICYCRSLFSFCKVESYLDFIVNFDSRSIIDKSEFKKLRLPELMEY